MRRFLAWFQPPPIILPHHPLFANTTQLKLHMQCLDLGSFQVLKNSLLLFTTHFYDQRMRHLHWLQFWSTEDTTCINCKFGHQMALLVYVTNSATRLI